MVDRDDFTKAEWQLLLDVPTAVGTAVMVAGASGMGSMKEALALASSTLKTTDEFSDCELVQAILAARVQDGQRSEFESLRSPFRGLAPDRILDETVALCAELTSMLQTKVSADEAQGFKEWVLDVGATVANAAKEGGFLGFGGERVSKPEREVLDAVKKALAL